MAMKKQKANWAQRRPRACDGLAEPPNRENDKLLRERELREMCGGISVPTVEELLETDPTFPRRIRIGRRWFYWRGDLLRWLERNQQPAA